MKKIVILGVAGHAKWCIDLISYNKEYSIIGINDPNLPASLPKHRFFRWIP